MCGGVGGLKTLDFNELVKARVELGRDDSDAGGTFKEAFGFAKSNCAAAYDKDRVAGNIKKEGVRGCFGHGIILALAGHDRNRRDSQVIKTTNRMWTPPKRLRAKGYRMQEGHVQKDWVRFCGFASIAKRN
jgi:hypothetical protein